MYLPDASHSDSRLHATPLCGWRLGEIHIDTRLHHVLRGTHKLTLERSGYALLLQLVENAGRTLTKEELLTAAWPGRVVSENSLAKAISKLRHALGDEQAELIQSVHGYGYRLSARVERLIDVPAEAMPTPAAPRLIPIIRRWSWLQLALALVCGVAVIVLFALNQTQPPASILRPALANEDIIAVLPLHDASPNGSLALLADGIGNELRDHLHRMPALRFVSRADSQMWRGSSREPAEIARELGANLIVDGEVSQLNNQLRVVLRLFDATGRIPSWSGTFERPAADQATLFEDLRAALLSRIGNRPGRWALDTSLGRGSTNAEAFQRFLRAATLFTGNNDPNNQRRAIVLLEEAIKLDPNYADAWLTLGGIFGGSGYYADTREELLAGRTRAIAAMDRGIALAPADPTNYLLRSEMRLLYLHDVAGAWADLDAAAARTPGGESASLLVWKARLLASMGRIDEAIVVDARAIALDPASGARRNQGWHYLAKRDTRNARAVLNLQLKDLPENPHTNFYLALCDIFEGQPDAALHRLEYSSSLFRLVGSAIAHHERGERAASDVALNKLIDQFAIADGYWVGAVYAWRGETEKAFHWLDRAIDGGDSSAMYLAFDPLLANIRKDPRYAQGLVRLGVSP